jgi:hypothetical protein
MRTSLLVTSLLPLWLLACGAPAAAPVVMGDVGVGGCPDPDDVLRAHVGWFGGEQYGASDDGWSVELGWRALDADDWSEAEATGAGTLQPGPLDGFELAGAGLLNPRTVTLYSADWPSGCLANVTGVYGVRQEDPSPFVVAHATLDGCRPEPDDGKYRLGWAVPDQGASRCELALPSSLGQYDYEDDLTAIPAVPAPWASQIKPPDEPCDGCPLLWSAQQVEGVTPTVSQLIWDWLPDEPCGWAGGGDQIFASDGEALAPVPGLENYELSGVLHDGGKAAVVLAKSASYFVALPASERGVPGASDELRRGHPHHEEDGEYLSLTEYCGP